MILQGQIDAARSEQSDHGLEDFNERERLAAKAAEQQQEIDRLRSELDHSRDLLLLDSYGSDR